VTQATPDDRGPKASVTFDRDKLRRRRIEFELTQAKLADQAGISADSVGRAEKPVPVSLEIAMAIGSALNIDYAELLLPAAADGCPGTPERRAPESHDPLDGIGQWIGISTPIVTEGLADLGLVEPQQGNEPNSPWYIRARLRFGIAEHEDDDGSRIYIGLRQAFLSVHASGYRVVVRSLIGQRAAHPNFAERVDRSGVDVIGPRPNGTVCLQGDPLEEHHLALIQSAGDAKGEESVTVTLRAFRGSFAASLSPTPDDSPENDVAATERDKVINALIAKSRKKDNQGRVLLARDTMKRQKPK